MLASFQPRLSGSIVVPLQPRESKENFFNGGKESLFEVSCEVDCSLFFLFAYDWTGFRRYIGNILLTLCTVPVLYNYHVSWEGGRVKGANLL